MPAPALACDLPVDLAPEGYIFSYSLLLCCCLSSRGFLFNLATQEVLSSTLLVNNVESYFDILGVVLESRFGVFLSRQNELLKVGTMVRPFPASVLVAFLFS